MNEDLIASTYDDMKRKLNSVSNTTLVKMLRIIASGSNFARDAVIQEAADRIELGLDWWLA